MKQIKTTYSLRLILFLTLISYTALSYAQVGGGYQVNTFNILNTSSSSNWSPGNAAFNLGYGNVLTTKISVSGDPQMCCPTLYGNIIRTRFDYEVYLVNTSTSASYLVGTHYATTWVQNSLSQPNINTWQGIAVDDTVSAVGGIITIQDNIGYCVPAGSYQVNIKLTTSGNGEGGDVNSFYGEDLSYKAYDNNTSPMTTYFPGTIPPGPLPYGGSTGTLTLSHTFSKIALVNVVPSNSISLPATLRTCGTSGVVTATVNVNSAVPCPETSYSYYWSSSSSSSHPTTASASLTPGLWTVTVTSNPSGATASASVNVVSTGAALSASTTAAAGLLSSSPICNGVTDLISGSASGGTTGTYTYLWSNGSTSTSFTMSPPAGGKYTSNVNAYTLTVTDISGCTASSTVNVYVAPVAAMGNVSICAGASTTLTPFSTPLTGYLWSTGATTSSITVSPTTTTNYVVTVTESHSCTSTASATVTVKSNPSVSPTSVIRQTNVPSSTTLTVSPSGLTYAWSNSATTQSTTVSYTGPFFFSPANYTVTVTGASTCSGTTVLTIPVTFIHSAPAKSPIAWGTEVFVKVYPNPTDHLVNFEYYTSEDGDVSLNIMDVSGRVLLKPAENKSGQAGLNNIEVNIDGLASGVYYYELNTDKSYKGKFVKK